ncbi:uncharacterized protein LOC109859353 [Pseudomyrmex gracilis]|uniref:uncharacterized protein LOC109859353 n=1 Tax=Pseudomyrmex gracilis TaxID=219809 RepID=UPI0009951844|nr:uncharacterized protein LOC109859353 [Pseudomyrmex gracilis]
MMLRKVFCPLTKLPLTQIYKHCCFNILGSKMSSKNSKTDSSDLIFSEEDKEKILNIINRKSKEDLLQYSITEKRVKNLELYRTDNGPYVSLEDLLKVKGMNNKCLYKFYKSIISGKKKGLKKIKKGLVLTPQTTWDDQKDVNTVLGIYVGQDMVSWALLNRDCKVLQWSFKSFPENESRKNIHSLLQMTIPIAATLPKADRYIMQEITRGYLLSRKSYDHYVQHSIINAIIMSYRATLSYKLDNNIDFVAQNCFILRQYILRKIYGLVLDNEVLSTQYMMQKLLQESDGLMKNQERLPNVLINSDLRNMYNEQSHVYKEQIGWSLLIALAFMELIVHQRTDMMIRSPE